MTKRCRLVLLRIWFYTLIVLLTIAIPGGSWADDLRLVPGCHPVFGCPNDEVPTPAPTLPPAPPQVPLFTRDIVARDTSPEMLDLLNLPTWDHAQAFVAKERERLQATMEAQRLIDAVKGGRKP